MPDIGVVDLLLLSISGTGKEHFKLTESTYLVVKSDCSQSSQYILGLVYRLITTTPERRYNLRYLRSMNRMSIDMKIQETRDSDRIYSISCGMDSDAAQDDGTV